MYRAFLGCVEGIQAQNTLILEVVEGVWPRSVTNSLTVSTCSHDSHRRPSLRSPAAPSTSMVSALSPALQETLSAAAELANACAARVLNVRSDEHAKLDLREFYTLFNATWAFVIQTEVISRRMIVGLRGAIVSQVRA